MFTWDILLKSSSLSDPYSLLKYGGWFLILKSTEGLGNLQGLDNGWCHVE